MGIYQAFWELSVWDLRHGPRRFFGIWFCDHWLYVLRQISRGSQIETFLAHVLANTNLHQTPSTGLVV